MIWSTVTKYFMQRRSHTKQGHRSGFSSLRPRQNGRHFPDDIFKCKFVNKNTWISIKISLKSVPKDPINNIPALVQIVVGVGPASSHYLNQWWPSYLMLLNSIHIHLWIKVLSVSRSYNFMNPQPALNTVPKSYHQSHVYNTLPFYYSKILYEFTCIHDTISLCSSHNYPWSTWAFSKLHQCLWAKPKVCDLDIFTCPGHTNWVCHRNQPTEVSILQAGNLQFLLQKSKYQKV